MVHHCYGPGQTVTLDGSDQPMNWCDFLLDNK